MDHAEMRVCCWCRIWFDAVSYSNGLEILSQNSPSFNVSAFAEPSSVRTVGNPRTAASTHKLTNSAACSHDAHQLFPMTRCVRAYEPFGKMRVFGVYNADDLV